MAEVRRKLKFKACLAIRLFVALVSGQQANVAGKDGFHDFK